MKKSLLKRIIMAAGSFLTFVMVLFVRVDATKTFVLGDEYKQTTISDAGNSSYFTFLSDASADKSFVIARVLMWLGFIILALAAIYFITLLVLELLGKDKIINKLNLTTKIVSGVILAGLFLVLLAGIDKKEIVMYEGLARETLDITLFGIPFVIAVIFGVVPIASEYMIQE